MNTVSTVRHRDLTIGGRNVESVIGSAGCPGRIEPRSVAVSIVRGSGGEGTATIILKCVACRTLFSIMGAVRPIVGGP